jgi:hypothetical protein
MMFMIPIPPISSEMLAIEAITIVKMRCVATFCRISSSGTSSV